MAVKAINLLKPKRLAEGNSTNDPECCPYNKIISHSINDCFVVKHIIDGMIKMGEIKIE